MPRFSRHLPLVIAILAGTAVIGRASLELLKPDQASPRATTKGLVVRQDPRAGTISVFRTGGRQPILTQNARPDTRPYIHPIVAPDGRTVTDRPGVFWGFTNLNGRDYFHNSQAVTGGAHRRPSRKPQAMRSVWQTVYDLLDAVRHAMLTQTERWTMREANGGVRARASSGADRRRRDVTIGGSDAAVPATDRVRLITPACFCDYPGATVNGRYRQRRPSAQRPGRGPARDVDRRHCPGRRPLRSVAHRDLRLPGQRWISASLAGRSPVGIGAAQSRSGNWTIKKGDTEILRYQLLVYTGALDDVRMDNAWAEYSGNRSAYATSALWTVAQREGREAKFLTADEAVAQMSVVNGYRVNAWAAEPMIVQPMAFCWDDRGRLWVAENRDYESRNQGFSAGATAAS